MKLPRSIVRRPTSAARRRLPHSLALLVSCVLLTTRLAAGSGEDTKKKLNELWSDTPAYLRLLNDPGHAKKPARIQSTVLPVPPLVTAIPGKPKITVMVSFIVDETGGVEAARVLESDDPRHNQSALDAVLQWRFFPAEGEKGFVKSTFIVPIEFKGERAEDIAIHLQVSGPQRIMSSGFNLRPPSEPRPPPTSDWGFAVQLQGPGAKDVKAGRIIIAHAVDDRGAELHSTLNPIFYHPGVGSVSAEDMVRAPFPPLQFSVGGVSPDAKKIMAVEGTIELVIPRLDPTGAKAVIESFPAKIGSPVKSDALAAAGVTLILYDKATCDRYLADKTALGGPAEYDGGDLFGVRPKWMPPRRSKLEVSANDLAVGISDPKGNLISLEFQTADGKAMRYDHNGWYHSGQEPGKRFDVYTLGSRLPADGKLVCWLVTDRSLFKIPLKIAELPLPDPAH